MDSGLIMGVGIAVVVVVITLASLIPMFFIFGKFFKRQAANAKLQQTGQPAQGQILAIQETGTRINDQPELAVTLNVNRPGQAPYQVQTTMVVSMLMIPRLQPGMTVPLKVDPMNPQVVAIDQASLGAVPMGMVGGMGPMQGAMPNYGQPPMAGMAGMNPAMMPGGMNPQQAMMMAQQAAAQAPAGGGILTCPQCRNPYASANPRCPNCGAAKPF
jgi:hypothetical protein